MSPTLATNCNSVQLTPMNPTITILGGAALGIAAGALLVPLTRRELAGAIARSSSDSEEVVGAGVAQPARMPAWHWAALGAFSGLLPAYVLYKVGWSIIAFPPLLLLVGLIQLGYCDLTRRLLPKTLVYALSAAVIVSGVVIAGVMHEVGTPRGRFHWWRRVFPLFFVMNLDQSALARLW